MLMSTASNIAVSVICVEPDALYVPRVKRDDL